MDPEAILDDLTKLSLKKRYKENPRDGSISSMDDIDNYVRDFQIDDSISECFVNDTEGTSRHMKPDVAIASGKRPKKNGVSSRKHLSDLFKRKSKDTMKLHVNEPDSLEEKENIYCEMKSCIPKSSFLNPPPSDDITNERNSEDDDYVLPTQYQPFERIMNLIRHNNLRELEQELPKYTWDVLISSESRNNILHQCVVENHPQCAEIIVSHRPELLFMKNSNGLIPSQLAIQTNKVNCLEVMMPSVSQHDHYVMLLAEESIKSDKVHCFRVVIECYNNTNETILEKISQVAAKYGNISCLQILIECGVNVWSADDNGQTILEIARDNNNQHCSHYLLILQLSQTLLYSYINTQVLFQRREAYLNKLEETIKQLQSRIDKESSVNQIERRLEELLELKEEINRILCHSNLNGANSSTTVCITRLQQVVEELTDQAVILQSIWPRQDELQLPCNKHVRSSIPQTPNTENTHIFSQIVKLIKDKTPKQINNTVNRILNENMPLVESESKDTLSSLDPLYGHDSVYSKQEVTSRFDPDDDVLGNVSAYRDRFDTDSLNHQGTQNSSQFIDDIFPENESKRMNFPLASNLTSNFLVEDEICVLPSRLIVPYVACNSDNNNISPESSREKLNYTSLNGVSCNHPRKFNHVNEEVQNVDLRSLKLHKHLQAVTKRENDLVEKVVPANRLLNSHQTKQTTDTAIIDKHSNSNHYKPKLKWSRKLFRTNSAPDKQISKSQFTENYGRKSNPRCQPNSKKKTLRNMWKPWYEISEDEKSLQHGQHSDTHSETSSRTERYI